MYLEVPQRTGMCARAVLLIQYVRSAYKKQYIGCTLRRIAQTSIPAFSPSNFPDQQRHFTQRAREQYPTAAEDELLGKRMAKQFLCHFTRSRNTVLARVHLAPPLPPPLPRSTSSASASVQSSSCLASVARFSVPGKISSAWSSGNFTNETLSL